MPYWNEVLNISLSNVGSLKSENELLFSNLFSSYPKGCKLLKINSSFRREATDENFYLHPFLQIIFYRTLMINFVKN